MEAGGAFPIEDAADLARLFARLAADPDLRRRAGEKARGVVESQAGSLEATLSELRPYLAVRDRVPA